MYDTKDKQVNTKIDENIKANKYHLCTIEKMKLVINHLETKLNDITIAMRQGGVEYFTTEAIMSIIEYHDSIHNEEMHVTTPDLGGYLLSLKNNFSIKASAVSRSGASPERNWRYIANNASSLE